MPPQSVRFNATSNIIELTCDDSDEVFNIHEDALKKVLLPGSFKALLGNNPTVRSGPYATNVTLPSKGLKHFAHWLYVGSILDPRENKDRDYSTVEDVQELITAHQLGDELLCVEFMDAVIDGIIEFCFYTKMRISLHKFVKSFTSVFEPGSKGRQLAVDFLAYGTYCDEAGGAITDPYFQLDIVGDDEFVEALARESLKVIDDGNSEYADWEGWEDGYVTLMLASGLIAMKRGGLESTVSFTPYDEGQCQYHRHTELGLKCYMYEG